MTPTSTLLSPSSTRFPSWTFDKPCTKMEWNSTTSIQLLAGSTTIETADLVIIGIFTPNKSNTTTTTEKTKHHTIFTGSVQKIDQGMNHALQDLYVDYILQPPQQDTTPTTITPPKVGMITPILRTIPSSSSSLPSTKSNTITGSNSNSNIKMKRYVIMNLGPSWGTDQEHKPSTDITKPSTSSTTSSVPPVGIGYTIGKVLATVCRTEKKIHIVTIHLPDIIVDNQIIIQNISTAFYTELYTDLRYKSKDSNTNNNNSNNQQKQSNIDCHTVYIRCDDTIVQQSSITIGYNIAKGIYLTKDIVNAPHNVLNSLSLAETAQRIVAMSNTKGRMKCNILNHTQCEEYGMGAYLGVARGSETSPQFIHITYTSPTTSTTKTASTTSSTPIQRKRIGIVGKGLLFDTGGYNIKTSMMEYMKFDCGGAAAVLGAAYAIGQLDNDMTSNINTTNTAQQHQSLVLHNIEIHFIIAACENMINEKAIVPSDILIASNGKTIEVMNTDAEGRLTLADALVYADVHCKCDTILELSTLTGACMVALGKEVCGLFTHDDNLANELYDISKHTYDKIWRMPLVTEYEEQIVSKIADLSNLGSSKYGGSITAALFLQHFVSKTKSFAHLDIAGPVWDDAIGATGFGTKLIIEYIKRQGMM
jgi:leucyl aminopeptidase